MILRAEDTSATFFSVYERHGRYDNDEEVTVFSGGSVQTLTMDRSEGTDIYSLVSTTGKIVHLFVADDGASDTAHTLARNGETISWTGPVGLHVTEGAEQETETIREGGQ